MAANPQDMVSFLRRVMTDEDGITIAPKEQPFRAYMANFLQGVRKVPADVSAPPGVDPYSYPMNTPGRWIFVFIPER